MLSELFGWKLLCVFIVICVIVWVKYFIDLLR